MAPAWQAWACIVAAGKRKDLASIVHMAYLAFSINEAAGLIVGSGAGLAIGAVRVVGVCIQSRGLQWGRKWCAVVGVVNEARRRVIMLKAQDSSGQVMLLA